MKNINIGNREVGYNQPPFIIAEMSGNHNQSLDKALEIVDAAASAGAHALKLQTYTADTMTIKASHGLFHIGDDDSLWKGNDLYDLYKIAHTPWEWHKPIMDRAQEHGMICFSSPFDASAVDFLEELNVPAYKIASFENTDWPLIKKAAATGKPLIISTGLATLSDIDEAVRVAREAGCKELILLKCTSAYPASPSTAHLRTIPALAQNFKCMAGLSDHTMGIGVSVAAVALGAVVIEKHFTTSRAEGGVDSAFSLEPHELKMLIEESEKAWQALGYVNFGVQEVELKSRRFKRSIYAVKNINKGDAFTPENTRIIRPGDGLPPKYVDLVQRRTASTDIQEGTPLNWEHI